MDRGCCVIVICPQCGARYKYDEARFGASNTKRLKCSRCTTVFEVDRPAGSVSEIRGRPAKGKVEETTRQLELKQVSRPAARSSLPDLAPLPSNRRYSLAVILGASAGKIFPVTKPRIVIGRGDSCDLQLSDSEISREHAMMEIRGEQATLIDLSSTNGTYVDGERTDRADLSNNQEFSLGTTTIIYIVTESDSMASG